MLTRWQWIVKQLHRTLWLRAASVGLLGILSALLALPVQSLITEPLPFIIGSSAVENILNILATSMLTVTIFSLSVMVSAYNAASTGVTPRATQLIKEDPTTQNALATFLGSFLFSLVGIIALSTGLYNEVGRFVLFVATIGVIASIFATLLRWIEHLSGLGRVGRTTAQVEARVKDALLQHCAHPNLGGQVLQDDSPPENANTVFAGSPGYVQHIDVAALAQCAAQHGCHIAITALPGTLVHTTRPLGWYTGAENQALADGFQDCFTIGMERSFEQDPRFGLSVLSEIASRALSPAVNDPGTAIDVLNRALRLLLDYGQFVYQDSAEDTPYPAISARSISVEDLFEDVFDPVARDGAPLFEVQLRLQKVLLALSQSNPILFGEAARQVSRRAMEMARNAGMLEADVERLQSVCSQLP